MENWSLYGRLKVGQLGSFAFLVLFVGFCLLGSYVPKAIVRKYQVSMMLLAMAVW